MGLRHLIAMGALAACAACTPDFATENSASVIIRITAIQGESGGGGAGSGVGTVLNSDVLTNGGIFNDNATLTVRNIPKNPRVTAPGVFNDVILERYEVHYIRSDGRNQEGIDVPFAISGTMNSPVAANATTDVPIVIVRHQAKVEPPLANLAGSGGAFVLTTFAEITIHGRTISGEAVVASGRLQISFADFADSQ
jgi:hypothetical protein